MRVAVRGVDVDAGAQACRGHVAPAGVYRDAGGFGNGNGQVESSAVAAVRLDEHGAAADGDVGGLGGEDLVCIHIRIGEGHGVGLHLDGGGIAGGDADIAAGVLNFDGGVCGNLGVEHLLIHVVLWQAEDVEEVVAVVVKLGKPGAHVAPSGGAKAQEGQQDEDAHKAAAAAHRGGAAQVHGPLAEQGQAGADQQKRPPAAIPGPEIAGGNAAGKHQQGNHADADEDDGADDGGNPRTVAVGIACFPGVALGAPGGLLLLPVGPPLGLGVVRRIRRRRAA